MPIAESGQTVYWKDGQKTTFNLLGDLQTARFPNNDEAFIDPLTQQRVPGFFDWFGGNWATPPADGRPGIRQSLIVDADTIPMVGRLLDLMRQGDNEWGVPPGPITDLMIYAAAATRFPNGWQGSPERRKYMSGSVATDPKPKPPAPDARDATIQDLRAKLAFAMKAREDAQKDELKLKSRLDALLADVKARAQGMLRFAGERGGGKYAIEMRSQGQYLLAVAEREKAGA